MHQIGHRVAGVRAVRFGAPVRGAARDRPERVQELVRRDDRDRGSGACLDVHDGEPESGRVARALATEIGLGDRAVEVDEVLRERDPKPAAGRALKSVTKRPSTGVSCALVCCRRRTVRSSWGPHENWARSFRGMRDGSSRRHQASIVSASVCIRLANVENRSGASDGRTYIQCTGKPDTRLGRRSA